MATTKKTAKKATKKAVKKAAVKKTVAKAPAKPRAPRKPKAPKDPVVVTEQPTEQPLEQLPDDFGTKERVPLAVAGRKVHWDDGTISDLDFQFEDADAYATKPGPFARFWKWLMS